jgi:antitoxin ParD1/3/4
MDVSLGTEWERFVAERVESGRYRTVGDVLRDGLRLLERRDNALERVSFSTIEELEGKLQAGLDQLESGQVVPGELAVKRLRERAAARRRANG